ncbi:MAG TPA: hypothetical protein VN040_06805 [Pseudosphingobacterium sp.]|nr:hypothetical protein [Pseudosphingobacterium sp.]
MEPMIINEIDKIQKRYSLYSVTLGSYSNPENRNIRRFLIVAWHILLVSFFFTLNNNLHFATAVLGFSLILYSTAIKNYALENALYRAGLKEDDENANLPNKISQNENELFRQTLSSLGLNSKQDFIYYAEKCGQMEQRSERFYKWFPNIFSFITEALPELWFKGDIPVLNAIFKVLFGVLSYSTITLIKEIRRFFGLSKVERYRVAKKRLSDIASEKWPNNN